MSTKLHGNNPLLPAQPNQLDPELRAHLLHSFPQGVVAFDVETTGISPLIDRIVELSAYKVGPQGDEIFDALINPGIEIDPTIVAIHGISNEMVADAPTVSGVLRDFIEFIGDKPLIAHNARFDVGFLLFNAHQEKIAVECNQIYCSLKFSRASLPGLSSYKLALLAQHFKIALERHHRALDDAIACLHVMALGLKNMPKLLKEEGFLYNLSEFSHTISLELPQHLLSLKKKVKFAHVILMKYAGGSMRGKWRPVRPISLLPMPQGNILYAHCLHSNIYKSFALSKIKEIREANQSEIEQALSEIKSKK